MKNNRRRAAEEGNGRRTLDKAAEVEQKHWNRGNGRRTLDKAAEVEQKHWNRGKKLTNFLSI